MPIRGFVTQGVGATNQGYPGHPFETFSYDQALYDAGIADFNVIPYASVLPENLEVISIDEARAGPSWVHRAVLEVIMAAIGFEYFDGVRSMACCVRRHGSTFIQEALGPVMAGGIIDHELTIRGLDISSGIKSFTDAAYVEVNAENRYAYTLSAIGFTQFSYAPVGS